MDGSVGLPLFLWEAVLVRVKLTARLAKNRLGSDLYFSVIPCSYFEVMPGDCIYGERRKKRKLSYNVLIYIDHTIWL